MVTSFQVFIWAIFQVFIWASVFTGASVLYSSKFPGVILVSFQIYMSHFPSFYMSYCVYRSQLTSVYRSKYPGVGSFQVFIWAGVFTGARVSAAVSQWIASLYLHMPKPSPHPTFYNYQPPSVDRCLFIVINIHPLCVVIIRYSVLGQLGRQFLDNLYARRSNGYPPRIAGFVKCISGRLRCPQLQNTCYGLSGPTR